MSKRTIGLLLLLLCSGGLGIGLGHWFFDVFDASVPPAVLTELNRATAYSFFLFRGFLVGLVVFVWSLVVLALSRLFTADAGDAKL